MKPPLFIEMLQTLIRRVETAIMVTLLLAMILLAIYQIVLRNFYDSGLIWGESLLRVMVLWVGLLGAMVASRNGDHININLITRHVSPHAQSVINTITALFTAIICGLLSYHSFRFVQIEFQDGLIAFAGIPTWACELIMPVAFAVISLRYLTLAALAMKNSTPGNQHSVTDHHRDHHQ